ncbi:conjugative transposon protein TraM [Ulvibacterium marinum]|uniref:conjugative transposon protein TraM n=1 Tax=Ulvibacterium marinum TaxID=2419782 RepID=UPI002493D109|nr:conjugative transposon protein TraM [Ulvibacterium marinum]
MKIDKKKITFAVVIGAVVIFIVAYSILTFGGDKDEQDELLQPLVPTLETVKDDYTSRLDAVDDLKEVRETNAPSIYDEKYLDSTGVYDPDFMEKEKIRLVDSIYTNSQIDYSTGTYKKPNLVKENVISTVTEKEKENQKKEEAEALRIEAKEMALEQQLFFASNPLPNAVDDSTPSVNVIVDRKEVLRVNDRIEMRTQHDVTIEGYFIPRNTQLFGIVSFKPNRVLLEIENIKNIPFAFKAYDYRDNLEGIYIKNSFREELRQQVLGDVIDDINVPGIPQVSGVKKIFQRSNRQVKVTVNNNYVLTLKVDTRQ